MIFIPFEILNHKMYFLSVSLGGNISTSAVMSPVPLTRISFQLDKLKPVMQDIADEKGVSLEDIFIKYMDLASVVSARQDALLKEDLNDSVMNFTEI